MSTMYLSIFTSFWRGFFTGVKSIISILTGAEQASGSILVFLDAHTEAAPGWLPPILNEIVQDRTRVIVPVVDDIMDDTFAYDVVENDHVRGGLDWKLLHAWIDPQLLIRDQTPVDAFPTPTMIGMISHKKSLITIFGHKHKILNFIKKFEIWKFSLKNLNFHKKFEIFHTKISTAFDFGLYME